VWLSESGLNRRVRPPQPANTCFLGLCDEIEIQRARQESVEIDGSDDSMRGCSIEFLQRPFTSLSCDEKVWIIEKGRKIPDFKMYTLNLQYKKTFVRHFRLHFYYNIALLCGFSKMNVCFRPCLLFRKGKWSWNSAGFVDLQSFEKMWEAPWK